MESIFSCSKHYFLKTVRLQTEKSFQRGNIALFPSGLLETFPGFAMEITTVLIAEAFFIP